MLTKFIKLTSSFTELIVDLDLGNMSVHVQHGNLKRGKCSNRECRVFVSFSYHNYSSDF